jgi:ribosomal protein S18 acetylase RimI-like enzyme
MDAHRFDVFGRIVLLRREAGLWRADEVGADGKRSPAGFVVPDFVAEDELEQFLFDLFHERATPGNGDVRRIGHPAEIEPAQPPAPAAAVDLQVTGAGMGDCRGLAELHVASWRAAYAHLLPAEYLAGLSVEQREASWRRVLAEARSELLVAKHDGRVVGLASFGASRDQDAPPARGELWAIYVHPEMWSTGVGRVLLAAARERLAAAGHESVSLWVLAGNERAIRFYAAAGFAVEPESAKEFELGGARVRELRMVSGAVAPA